MQYSQLRLLLAGRYPPKEVFAVDEDANLTFRIVRVEENGEGIWLMMELVRPE